MSTRPCTGEDRATCEAEMPDPAHLAWSCEKCPKARPEDINPYTAHILWLITLQAGGFPLDTEDMSLEMWTDLGRVKQALEAARETARWRAILGKSILR